MIFAFPAHNLAQVVLYWFVKMKHMILSKYSLSKLYLTVLLISTIMSGCVEKSDQQSNQTMESPAIESATDKLRHVVLFKFKEDADPEAIARAEEAFIALPTKIPEIKDFEWGLNNSPEGLNKGFTHCYLLTFDSEEGRAIYLPHPDHKAFGALLKDILEDVTVIDYWAK